MSTGREGKFKEQRKFSEPLDSKSGAAVILIILGPEVSIKTILNGLDEWQVNDRVPYFGCILPFPRCLLRERRF